MVSLNRLLLCALSFSLPACAVYQAKTLPTTAVLPNKIPDLVIEQRPLPFTSLRSHRLTLTGPLDMDDIAIVAVLNNPDLKIARDDAGIARAQAFSSALLPDPQLGLSSDISNTGGPGSTKAISAGISYDLIALITHDALDSAARAETRKTDLTLLWQEWQVVAQARLLYVRLVYAQQVAALLATNRELFTQRVNHNQIALDKNYISNDAWLPDATALQDIQKQSNDLERLINQTRHDFNSLLGLSPDAQVELKDDASLTELDEAAVLQNIAQLPTQRPDLLALRYGFDAQDERYRAALLAQFPSLTVGFTRARDNSGVFSNGIGVNLNLPLFNRNRGNIAIEQATREKLHDDYQQRLNSASSDIHKLLQDQHINLRQLDEIQTALIQYQATVAHADLAYQKNIVDSLVYSNAHSVLLSKQIEALNLQQSITEQRIALQALIGGDLPLQRTAENNNHDQ
ncbi:outer membrane protein TolC [Oxalobacteraceae bacterium GrIS 1.18]